MSHTTVAGSLTTAPSATTAAPAPATPSRAWAWAGVAAGALGLAGIAASMSTSAVYTPGIAGDAEGIVEAMATQVPSYLAFHLLTMAGVVLLPVVAAGLHRRLAATTPAGSLLGPVAAIGLVLVAVAGLMGSGLDTEFVFGLSDPDQMVPETAVLFGHWVGTIPWLWVGAGVSGVAVAVAALRHRAVPRWVGVVGLVLGGLTLLVGVSPLQYLAGFTGPVWLLVTMLGFAVGDRRARRA